MSTPEELSLPRPARMAAVTKTISPSTAAATKIAAYANPPGQSAGFIIRTLRRRRLAPAPIAEGGLAGRAGRCARLRFQPAIRRRESAPRWPPVRLPPPAGL